MPVQIGTTDVTRVIAGAGVRQATGCLPYAAPGGNLFVALQDDAGALETNYYFWMYRSTDGGTTWTQFAQSPFPPDVHHADGSDDAEPQTFSSYRLGDIVHYVLMVENTGTAAKTIYYTTFDLTTETWGALETVKSGFNSREDLDIVVRSDGIVMVGYGAQARIQGTDYQHIYYARRATTGTWTIDQQLANNGQNNWEGVSLAVDATDVLHAIFCESALAEAYYVTIDAAFTRGTPTLEFTSQTGLPNNFVGKMMVPAAGDLVVPYIYDSVSVIGGSTTYDFGAWSLSGSYNTFDIMGADAGYNQAMFIYADANVGAWFFASRSSTNTTTDPMRYYKWGGAGAGWFTEAAWTWETQGSANGAFSTSPHVNKVAQLLLGVVYHNRIVNPDGTTSDSVWYHEVDVSSAASLLYRWDGTAWVAVPEVKVWDGTAWTAKPMFRWDGTTWQSVT